MVLAGSRDRNPMKRAFQPDLWPRKQTKRQAETIKLAVARNRWFESISLQRRANFRFLSGGAPSCRVPKLAVTARCALPDRRLRCRLHPQRRPWRHEVSAYQPASEQRATARPAARCPARRCVRAMKRSRAEQRGDNQVDRARVLEVRIHSPPADSPSLSRFRLRSWKSPGFAPVWRRRQAVRSAETRKVQQHRAEER